MREILFRGQHRRYGEKVNMAGDKLPSIWVYGGVLQGKGGRSIIYGSTSPDGEFEGKYPVYTDTLGQYTGLTDKNGKRIFEGDIIRVTFESDCLAGCEPECWSELFEVFYDNEHHAWFTKINDEIGEWLYEYDGECEVISTIHDSPELLGGAE